MNKKQKTYLIQIGLFIATLVGTTFAGAEWSISKFLTLGMTWDDFLFGFNFSIPFLLILTVHEFGHYFTARYHKIKVTFPYYIPMWLGFLGPFPTIGTMGAFIKIKENISSRIKYFDVGVSGPIAGFLVAIVFFIYGFTHLPETEYIYEIHPEYEVFGENFEEKMAGLDTVILKSDLNPDRMLYDQQPDTIRLNRGSISFGDNLLMNLGRTYLAPDDRYVPSSSELMHYPLLLASFLAFFFTALNLLPIGQLDGGHVVFGLFGPKHHAIISRVLFTAFLFYAGLGWVTTADLVDSSIEGLGSFLLSLAAYLFIVYWCAYSVFKEKRDRLLYATVMLTVQFFIASIFKIEGYTGWLLFSLLIGRFIGVDHPPVIDNKPLSAGRKVLGWIALIIFVLCFSPQPLVVNGL
ncbi:Peptidase family M50 [Ekhidna lutea]|uniref:Peptidase family M50 n=1 Tax=Ekhidna lutea TaxID=447679 RepID=A0A239HZK8_EKHLU|nr:site-2 protease family protein [Ekhidna lutea]SNS86639.1 Peptidase family M50 [Ekhidna lutea]